ncbi:MAG TPA: DUF5063 domain-containing protein [Armatimonadota bacterium]|nr:DUF5063 domain-containing protein [Armatimonadota bacterium]
MISIDIYQVIEEYLDLIENGRGSIPANEAALVLILDKLALAWHSAKPYRDEQAYPDPPWSDQDTLRKMICGLFPNYGWYQIPLSISALRELGEMGVGDAIDDLLDIAKEMYQVQWRWQHTSHDDALWYFHWSYGAHWGEHLRALQLYLYDDTYERGLFT